MILKKRVIKFYNNDVCDDEKFKKLMKRIYQRMIILERNKFS
jgi:hypothetical protein